MAKSNRNSSLTAFFDGVFAIIFITWVNHTAILKLVDKTSSAFVYANGFVLLISVIWIGWKILSINIRGK